MKKRLLITSIVMMLVVAVALSTATYAWFTANSRVDMGTMTLKAATSGDASLGIGWLYSDAALNVAGTSISQDLYGVLSPMAPEALTEGSTLSSVLFRSATIREENSQFVFNDQAASYVLIEDENAKAKSNETYYELVDGVYVEKTGLTADTSSVNGYYTKNFAPMVYNNTATQAFFVRNSSGTNPISSVTVNATFIATNAYILTHDATFATVGKKYYTFAEKSVEANADVSALYIKTGKAYSAATGTAQAGTTYYEKTEITVVASGASTNEVDKDVTVTADTYYEVVNGSSLIRVALFTKPQSTGKNTTENVNYTLLCVLGEEATDFVPASISAFDKNTTYYTRSGAGSAQDPYVYSQVAASAAYDSGSTYYTAVNTAVYGDDGKFTNGKAVKDLGHYTKVVTSKTLVTNLGAEKQVDIVAIAWLDGTLLDDAHANVLGQVSLNFQAA